MFQGVPDSPLLSSEQVHNHCHMTAPTAPKRFDRTDWLHVGGMAGFIALLTAMGWFVMIAIVDPAGYSVGTQGAFGTGLGLTAYLLGMRHAFDADHIAAIDNTTRKLVGDGQRARGVGFWFSLGHSSVVFVLCLFLALGVRTVTSALDDDGSAARQVLGVAGTIISGAFLVALGLLNLIALVGIGRVFARMRSEELDEAELEHHLNSRGFLARILGKVLRMVNKPWHMFPVGFIFGLGFDTATEVTLLVLAGGAAAFALPWYAILVLPVLFAAGMSLFDTADGVFMSAAYGWAFLKPVRKVFYNLTVTALSVLVALVIGGIELLQLLATETGATSGPLAAIAGLDLEHVGYVIVGLFVATWLLALGVWRFGRIEERWTADATPVEST
ncbi:MAG: nickel/cobalt transporter (NiCoT) family protein [Pseudonocardiales bacterium]|jgi:high-affinity nickel-transport protein|nr:nickel/cobalt transporter (NiCoT) family protein [Pseudonocardiales bacterium]